MRRGIDLSAWASEDDLGPALAAAGVLAAADQDVRDQKSIVELLSRLARSASPLVWRDPFPHSSPLEPAALADAWRRSLYRDHRPQLLLWQARLSAWDLDALTRTLEAAGALVTLIGETAEAPPSEEPPIPAMPPLEMSEGAESPEAMSTEAERPPPAIPRSSAPPPSEMPRMAGAPDGGERAQDDSPPSSVRYAQGRVLRGERQVDVFTAGAEHEVRIFIGPPEEGALTTSTAFPEVSRTTTVELEVVFAPLEEGEPQSGSLTLPPSGRSTAAIFNLRAPTKMRTLSARVVVLHGNRVLQSWLLTGPVITEGALADGRIAFVPEALPRLHTDDLDQRQAFDAAVVANHGSDGRSRALVAGKHAPVLLRLSERELSDALDRIRGLLEEAVHNPRSFAKLTSRRSVALLVKLAHLGITLGRPFGLEARAGGRIERLQIVDAHPEAYLPLEFLYDFPAPKAGAKLCAEGTALLTDSAGGVCSATHTRDVVCPLGFWGLSRVIERHLFRPDRGDLPSDGWHVAFEPVTGRDRLRLRRAAVFAASERVDRHKKGLTARTESALRKGIGSVTTAADWEAWVAAVAAERPGLLLALPHVETHHDFGLPAMWIGQDAALASSEICAEHVRGDVAEHVAVFLLGCGTGVSEAPFTHFPAAFREGGAQLVFGTLTSMLGRHAAPIAVTLTDRLLESCDSSESVTLGEELRALRRGLLAEVGPAALCLVAYGDADWILEVA